ncbi:MAG: Uma2 family endonuclease, partial [Opitutaceae bacterium]|nr:Uma2 family endonuclease [Cytophagales bacterium]
PDLVFEIVSIGSVKRDLDEKFHLYEQSGVKEYWVVFPFEKQVSVYLLEGTEYKLMDHFQFNSKISSANLIGFSLDLEKVSED